MNSVKKNDEFIIDITDVTNEGNGIGRYEGMAVFVPLTAVGDTVLTKAIKVKKSYAIGKAMEIITPSDDRIDNDCEAFKSCGGCAFRHISYEAECRLKENKVYESVKRIGGIDLKPNPIISADNVKGYRNKAQYPVSAEGKVGFYAFHSHRIIPCTDCLLQPKIFSEILKVTEDWIKEKNISIYSEENHSGLLRHIYLRIAETSGEMMFTAVINGDELPFNESLIERLKSVCGESLKSIQLNINKKDTNVVLGTECRVLYGEPYITDILCGIKIRLSSLSFYQVNRSMAEKLYEKASEYAEPCGKNILDLYCGAGTIGLSMARSAKSIIGVEIIPQAIEDAKFNASDNGIENAEFICSDAAKAAEELARRKISPDVVIVDPPRKGCSAELIETITDKFCPERVVYVSCDPATLARDIKLFCEKGYELLEYTPVDLFPRTAHVETVALFLRDINS